MICITKKLKLLILTWDIHYKIFIFVVDNSIFRIFIHSIYESNFYIKFNNFRFKKLIYYSAFLRSITWAFLMPMGTMFIKKKNIVTAPQQINIIIFWTSIVIRAYKVKNEKPPKYKYANIIKKKCFKLGSNIIFWLFSLFIVKTLNASLRFKFR